MRIALTLDRDSDAEVNDYVRGPGSYDMAITALQNLQDAGFSDALLELAGLYEQNHQADEAIAIYQKFADRPAAQAAPASRTADKAR